MKSLCAFSMAVVAAVLLAVLPGSAAAVTGGHYDGTGHPYVVYLDNGVFACSGTLLSPTVIVTAAHCFSTSTSALGTNSATGAPLVRVSFDPNLANSSSQHWYIGSYYWNPGFQMGGGGLPGFDTHDVAVVILTAQGCSVPAGLDGTCGPVPASASDSQYGALPSPDQVDGLAMRTPIDLVGFGVQNFVNGGGPCGGPCTKRPGDVFTRFVARTTLIASNDRISAEFVKLHANKGGTCFGDSGGPDLLGGTNTVLAVNSFVANNVCAGNTYSYRIDTTEALTWITATVTAQGGSLP